MAGVNLTIGTNDIGTARAREPDFSAGLITGVGQIAGSAVQSVVSKVVKGKGTSYAEVYNLMPKFFYTYGTGTPPPVGKFGSTFRISTPGAFDIQTGRRYLHTSKGDAYQIYLQRGGVQAEMNARKPGERTTKDVGLTMLGISSAYFKGYRVINGIEYDAAFLDGESPVISAATGQSEAQSISVLPEPKVTQLPVQGDAKKGLALLGLAIGALNFIK